MAKTGTLKQQHWTDQNNPTGGITQATGLLISWQNGALGRGADRKEPNGAFVEDVLAAVIGRIQHYQEAADGRFACAENVAALQHLAAAAEALDSRTRAREARNIEGTHTA